MSTPRSSGSSTTSTTSSRESRDLGVEYPIAIDSDYGVWQAFSNHFWPALYIADAEGRIRYHHFGEGEYAMAEMVIQQLLARGRRRRRRSRARVRGADRASRSPPTGGRCERPRRTSPTAGVPASHRRTSARLDVPHAIPSPRLSLNEWAPAGPWTLARTRPCRTTPGARIAFQFQARDVNLVMGPAARGHVRPVPRPPRRPRARRRPRLRRRRAGQRNAGRPASLSADPPAGPRRGVARRDRVPRRRRRGVLLHLRLSAVARHASTGQRLTKQKQYSSNPPEPSPGARKCSLSTMWLWPPTNDR